MKAVVNTANGLSLNMREEPSFNGWVLAQIPNGVEIEIIVVNEFWSKVTYNNVTGYINNSYVQVRK